jgi:hypothetical protein
MSQYFAIVANNKLKRQTVRMAQTNSDSQESNITRVSDTFVHIFTTLEKKRYMSDEEKNEKSTEMKEEKIALVTLLCARAHKNDGYALHFSTQHRKMKLC